MRPRVHEFVREELERKYLVEHRAMSEIAEEYGCSRQTVFDAIKRFGIDGSKAERFVILCDVCGRDFEITRKRWRLTSTHHCSSECYYKGRRNGSYVAWRNGQRLARKVMEDVLRRKLGIDEVVHHEDGDNRNNAVDNLRVFESQSEHVAYHHRKRIERQEMDRNRLLDRLEMVR
jgi:hypothetical protein